MKTSIYDEVKFSNTDKDCQLSFGTIIDYLQNCSNAQSEALGVGMDYQIERKRAWILSSWEIKIKALPKYMDNIEITTWPYSFKGACGRRNYTITDEKTKEVVVEADSVWALFDTEKNFLTRIRKEDSDAYECEDKLNMEYSLGKIKRADNYERKDIFKVRKYQLDINKHMNNGWYVKIAEEFIEEKSMVNSIRVEYKKSAMYNDDIISYVAKEDNRIVIELRNEKEEIFAIIEFGIKTVK